MRHLLLLTLFTVLLAPLLVSAQATQPAVGKFPGIVVDVKNKQVRVEAETLQVDMRLEFFAVNAGGPDHESVLRTHMKPSDLHTALLMLGLKPGEPVKYSEAANKWIPPHGPPLQIHVEYQKDGKTVSIPAYRMIRNADTKKTPDAFTWIFTGSRVMDDGTYAADTTGYIISLVNFDLTMVDVPDLASNDNETLEWEYNPDTVPKMGTKVTMVIEPAGKAMEANPSGKPADAAPEKTSPATLPQSGTSVGQSGEGTSAASASTLPIESISREQLDERLLAAAKTRWENAIRPSASALQTAAQTHYEVINDLRREQQRLIDEADRVQRAIDQLEKDYQTLTTPQPSRP